MSKLLPIEPLTTAAQTLGVYVQVPYCFSKCTFCNFSSRVGIEAEIARYWRSLSIEIRLLDRAALDERVGSALRRLPVDTIYFGGGTPTMDSGEGLCRAVEQLRGRFNVLAECEFTVELTPGARERNTLERLKARGVNRLSIGAQTFDDAELRAVGRLHSASETHQTIRRARELGFANISLDVIAGLPHQTESSWRRTLDEVINAGAEHVSVYIFEVDDRSRLGHEVIAQGDRYSAAAVPDAEFTANAYEVARKQLQAAGYGQYEISNFARPGFESKHNHKYWRLEPYWGFGAGAHSFDGGRRWSNRTEPAEYAELLGQGTFPIADSRQVAPDSQIEEFFFLGLRQVEGVHIAYGEDRWGARRFAPWRAVISDLLLEGWLEESDGWIRLREDAYLVSNEIFERFLLVGADCDQSEVVERTGARLFQRVRRPTDSE